MAWVTIAAAAVSAASALVGNMQKNSEATRQIEQFAIDMVAIDTNAAMQQEGLSAQASSLQQNVQQQSLQIEMSEAATQAEMEVAAAASGTAGQSVDIGLTSASSSAGRAQGTLQQQEKNMTNFIEQSSRDIEFAADAARSDLEVGDTKGQLLEIFGAGLQGFLAGR